MKKSDQESGIRIVSGILLSQGSAFFVSGVRFESGYVIMVIEYGKPFASSIDFVT